ncbi:hypothetical protein ANN_07886 [Periplaneta americana]|uniref:Uncharacterized protein n=1 Tax=Periplaneta americana TaxID=6978 RepID=A0ABQ8T190_PERAM|nr:hypothetical protein ANN_07886 [Periplaneta americana]
MSLMSKEGQHVAGGGPLNLAILHNSGTSILLHLTIEASAGTTVPLIVEGLLEVGQIDLAKSQSPLPLQGLKIIDIGCGAGILTEALAKLGAEITGVDASQNMIKVAKIHAEKDSKISNSITYVSETIEEHAKKYPGYYDVIVASEVLEHVNNKELFVHCSAATVKPGGSFFITTPNRTFTVWFGLILISEYISKRIPRGTHYMHMMYTPEETRSLLKKSKQTKIVKHLFEVLQWRL